MATETPSALRRSAAARPRPSLPPVMMATLPASPSSIGIVVSGTVLGSTAHEVACVERVGVGSVVGPGEQRAHATDGGAAVVGQEARGQQGGWVAGEESLVEHLAAGKAAAAEIP